jgi:hypothetical protein
MSSPASTHGAHPGAQGAAREGVTMTRVPGAAGPVTREVGEGNA